MLPKASLASAPVPSEPMLPRPFRVRRSGPEAQGIANLELQAIDGRPFPFAPGQFNMLYLFGVGEVPISISGDPARPDVVFHTLRAVGAVTRGLCALGRDAVVGVRGPFGTGWPLAEAKGHDVVFIGGGIGLSPLRPAILHVLAHRSAYGRVVVLHGARGPGEILHRKDLERWRSRFDVEVNVTVDRAPADWHGHVGVVTALIARAGFDPRDAVAMLCGPEIMMRFAARELLRRGTAPDRVFVSMERNMKCAVGLCGHCQFGPDFVCKDGPVFRLPRVASLWNVREV
jgi:NAD(P)H-flavin reductase